MLLLALLALVATSIYSIAKAPAALRIAAALLFTLPASLGYVVTFYASATEDTRMYYPIAGAIGAWIVGAVIFDALRKRQNKQPESSVV